MFLQRFILVTSVVAAGLMGCNANQSTRSDMTADPATIDIAASSTNIVAGEISTISMRSENTLGRDALVEWTTTGGRITTEANGTIARARFDEPGAYTVTAKLTLDGREVDSDSVTINVRPVG